MNSSSRLNLQIENLVLPIYSPIIPIWARVLNGEILVVRRGLQQIGIYEQITRMSAEALFSSVAPHVVTEVLKNGFERIHEFVKGDELFQIYDRLGQAMEPLAPKLGKLLSREILGWRLPIFVERRPNVRLQVPFDSEYRQKSDVFMPAYKRPRGDGKLTPHGPHRDSWFDCPSNGINFWIAMGRIIPGNSLMLYPDMLHRKAPIDANGEIVAGESLGTPAIPSLQSGDMLVFRGEHLHASELNISKETRYVLSVRITLGRPRIVRRHIHHYLYTPLARKRLKAWAEYPAKMTIRYARQRISSVLGDSPIITRILKKIITPRQHLLGTRLLNVREIPVNWREPNVAEIPLAKLQNGIPIPISNRVCVVLSAGDRVEAIARRCTHEGADLAFARVIDETIVCPWHGARFNLGTGQAGCRLKALKTHQCTVEGDIVRVSIVS